MGTVPPRCWSIWNNTIYNTNMKFLVLACLAVACSARPQFLFLVPGTGGDAQTADQTLTQEQISTLQRNLQALLPQLLASTAAADATAATAAATATASEVAAAPELAAAPVTAPVLEAVPVAEAAPVSAPASEKALAPETAPAPAPEAAPAPKAVPTPIANVDMFSNFIFPDDA